MTLSQSLGYTFIYFTYYEHIHYMLQKNKKGLLTVKKVDSVIIQWHMFIFFFKQVWLESFPKTINEKEVFYS